MKTEFLLGDLFKFIFSGELVKHTLNAQVWIKVKNWRKNTLTAQTLRFIQELCL